MPRRRTHSNSLKFAPKHIHNKISLNIEELKSFFINHTLKECSKKFRCSVTTIKRKLKSANVDTSIHNNSDLAKKKSAEASKRGKTFPSTKQLKILYIDQNLDSKTIAEQYHLHYNTILKMLRKLNLKKTAKDVSRSMMSRHYKNHGYAHPAQRPDVLVKTRRSGQKAKYADKTHKEHKFRSLHELGYALYLDSKNLEWYYEEMRINYIDNMSGKWKVYIIDFTIINGDKVEWVEVKPNNKMIPIDKRIYAERRAEDAGTIYRGLTDNERKTAYKLLLNGYRKKHCEFLHNKPKKSAKQISYYFKSKKELKNFSQDGWRKHRAIEHSRNLWALKLKRI